VGKPKGKRPQGRSRRRWEDNVKTDLRELVIPIRHVLQWICVKAILYCVRSKVLREVSM
jgi:hypothetical protein